MGEIIQGIIKKVRTYISNLSNVQLLIHLGAVVAAVVVILLICVAACGGSDDQEESSSSSSSSRSSSSSSSSSSEPEEEKPEPIEVTPQLDRIEEAFNLNSDVVGWFYIPGLEDIDQPVVHDPNSYSYTYRTPTGEYDYNQYWITGAYFTHLRNTFGDRDAISRNTVIFGHSDLGLSMDPPYSDDDPTGPAFSQIYNFLDEDFAKKTPYLFFSTPEEDMVFEVFAVYYNDSGLWYIEPEPTDSEYETLLETARARSQYNYEVDVTTDDKILTLSTCTVHFGYNVKDNYRFVVMAKLIEPEDATKTEAVFEVNPDPEMP